MAEIRASIDLGTHTARLLIAQGSGTREPLRALVRKRAYTLLGEGFDRSGKRIIQPRGIDRALSALRDFSRHTGRFKVKDVEAVATGVVREAVNSHEFLTLIHDRTGISVRPITGHEEALFTGKGVLQALDIRKGPYVIFDLGGGSTEFLISEGHSPIVRSVQLGAYMLTQGYLKAYPPDRARLEELSRYIDKSFEKALPDMSGAGDNILIAGTGGTVATLATMLHGLSQKEITPESVNGLVLKRTRLDALFKRIKGLSIREIWKLPGLEPERAGVILAGSLVVIRLLHFFRVNELAVSLSDLLEGILIHCQEGDKNE